MSKLTKRTINQIYLSGNHLDVYNAIDAMPGANSSMLAQRTGMPRNVINHAINDLRLLKYVSIQSYRDAALGIPQNTHVATPGQGDTIARIVQANEKAKYERRKQSLVKARSLSRRNRTGEKVTVYLPEFRDDLQGKNTVGFKIYRDEASCNRENLNNPTYVGPTPFQGRLKKIDEPKEFTDLSGV